MGLFPTDAVNGQRVTNAKGTVFEYDDVEDKWFIVFETDVYTQAQVDALLHAEQHAMDNATQHTSSDVATLNASITKHGFLKKLDNVATNFMNGEGDWAEPAGDEGQAASLNAEDITIAWNVDGAANTNYQSIDLDSYFTVPASVTAVLISIRLRDGVAGSNINFGATETDGLNMIHTVQVINIDSNMSTRCPLAEGNIIKMKCNINPSAFTRIWIRLIEYYYD